MIPVPFEIGQRVSRRGKNYLLDTTTPDRIGTISGWYYSIAQMGVIRPDWILYVVRWDDTGQEERGYMREGLTPIDDQPVSKS